MTFQCMAAKYFVSIIFNPILCVFGTIIGAVKNNEKELKENVYVFMSLNAKFNCAFCLINVFNLMSECIVENGIYCSAIRKLIFVQYFKIIAINYLGSVIKMCSNTTYLFMTLNRYMLIGKEHNRFLERLSNLSMKRVYVILGVSSSILSLVKLFLTIQTFCLCVVETLNLIGQLNITARH